MVKKGAGGSKSLCAELSSDQQYPEMKETEDLPSLAQNKIQELQKKQLSQT